jgi:large-conductance mechanosensitive channel
MHAGEPITTGRHRMTTFVVEGPQKKRYSYGAMDDTPKAFFEELRSSILKKRVGQIALAVVLAEAVWHLVNSLTWYLIIPLIGKSLNGHTESVFFEAPTRRPIPWENLFGSIMEFVLTVIVVFYLNRWIHRKPLPVTEESGPEYSSVGEPLTAREVEMPEDRQQP